MTAAGSFDIGRNIATSFDNGWEFRHSWQESWNQVTLPHDAMMEEGRDPEAPSGTHMAFFLGGSYVYRKVWHVPASLEGKQVSILFGGVFRRCRVVVNGQEAGGNTSGYTTFELPIDPYLKIGDLNLIEVHVDNSTQPAARWYTGSGIYRTVQLLVRSHALLRHDGIRLETLSVAKTACVAIQVLLDNPDCQVVSVSLRMARADRVTTTWKGRTTHDELRHELEVPEPVLWCAETPSLYDCTVDVNGDVYQFRYGLRTLEWVPQKGLLINNQPVLLRGACVHADNGVLGAATFKAAELRRMALLKQAGFNAVRMSHHPAAPALLEACDEIGLYVVDEFADTWFYPKISHDDSGSFHEEWKDDLAAMICKDRNHPSVIMYSLGNEVTEPETAYGQALAKTILDYQKSLDPTRPNTIAINLMLAVLKFSRTPPGSPDTRPPTPSPLVGNVGSSLINQLANFFTPLAMTLVKLKQCDLVTKELFSCMDIAGYNYGTDRYLCDSTSYPERLILGSETFPCDIARNWDLVERVPNLIGDFMWVGWDYLGETGIGGFDYNVPWWSPGRFYKSFPYLTAGTGALDIIGVEGSVALVAKAAWKLLHQPVVTVRPLNISHMSYRTTLWRRTDAVPGWAWKNCEGKKAYVEVISQQEEIELLLNGRSLGRSKGGLVNNYTARFTVAYEPGALIAIGYSGGSEVSRSIVRSAGPATIRAVNERSGPLSANG